MGVGEASPLRAVDLEGHGPNHLILEKKNLSPQAFGFYNSEGCLGKHEISTK
jgi:hypothetical protein